MKTNKLVTKYVSLIKSNKMTKNEINAMRKVLGHCSSLVREDKRLILDAFYRQVDDKGGIRITAEHTEQGINFLKRVAFTTSGMCRNTKNYPFMDREITVIRNFKEFRLTGLREVFNGMGDVLTYEPVWEVISKQKLSFEYICGHWGSVEIVG